ncbi:hypothetical protein EV126DRAFT_413692 [Verticillium dahliae]|nr:hypothetical protein EV126DRAFT_413692 [Verticillium dahliae]
MAAPLFLVAMACHGASSGTLSLPGQGPATSRGQVFALASMSHGHTGRPLDQIPIPTSHLSPAFFQLLLLSSQDAYHLCSGLVLAGDDHLMAKLPGPLAGWSKLTEGSNRAPRILQPKLGWEIGNTALCCAYHQGL